MQGSEQELRQQIKRSLLIEQLLKNDVENKSAVSLAEVQSLLRQERGAIRAAGVVRIPEHFHLAAAEADRRTGQTSPAEGAKTRCKQAKATKSYQEFGLLAEKISEDDFRVNMGDHKAVGRDKLPPQVVKALAGHAARTGQRR